MEQRGIRIGSVGYNSNSCELLRLLFAYILFRTQSDAKFKLHKRMRHEAGGRVFVLCHIFFANSTKTAFEAAQ